MVHGASEEEWRRAPATGVQVVVEWRIPAVHERPWAGVTDRLLWTGLDWYDPFGWGPKAGTLLSRADYDLIWERAAHGDDHPHH